MAHCDIAGTIELGNTIDQWIERMIVRQKTNSGTLSEIIDVFL